MVLYSIMTQKGFQKLLLLNYYHPDSHSSYGTFIVCVCGGRCGVDTGSHVIQVGLELTM